MRAACGAMCKAAWAGWPTRWRSACHDLGVEIRRESPVKRIVTDDGQAPRRACSRGTTRCSKRQSSPPASTPIRRSSGCSIRAELPAEFRAAVSQDRLRLGLGQDQPGPLRAAAVHLPAATSGIGRRTITARSTSAPRSTTSSGPSTTPSTAGPAPSRSWRSRCPRASIARSLRQGQHVMNIFVQYAPYKLADGELGRHQGDFRRPLHRAAGPLRPERARRDPAPAGAHAARPGADARPDRRQHHARGDDASTSSSAMRPVARLGRPSHADPRPLPLRRRQPSRRRRAGRLRPQRRRGNPPRFRLTARMPFTP